MSSRKSGGLWKAVVFSLFVICVTAQAANAQILISTNASWKLLKGTNNIPSPWRNRIYDDSAWTTASAPFSYSMGLTRGTILSDMRNVYSSIYLRKSFTVASPSDYAVLDINMFCDDGMIVWVNGTEVTRFNMPSGTLNNRTPASSSLGQPPLWRNTPLPDIRNLLVSGENTLAVQVFNSSLGGSDFGFDMELVRPPLDATPPKVASISPPPGKVAALDSVQITFTEPVIGVEASDLRVNDGAAESVTGSGAVYTFRFAQPPVGPAHIRFGPGPGILDTGRPANAYDETADLWSYELEDRTAPLAASIHPPAGGVTRSLTQVELLFSEPVTGIDAADFLVNGQPATNVTGFAAGPYLFQFPAQASGSVQITWSASHGITDLAATPNAFAPVSFGFTVNPSAAPAQIRINEILAANESGLMDEDGERSDWIELHNYGTSRADLTGWSLTDDPSEPGKWQFFGQSINPGAYLVVFASGKDRRAGSAGNSRAHTNFRLSSSGDYLALHNAESPRQLVHALSPGYPEQKNDYSYGYLEQPGAFRYLQTPTPGAPNSESSLTGICPPVHFSVARSFFDTPFNLHLSCPLRGATIRYTLDGTVPTLQNGILFTNAFTISQTRMVRAAAFAPNLLPSSTDTHTYILASPASRRGLPALSIVTASNHLYGRTGIMETSPRNTTQHGIAWERPVSVEYIRPEDNSGFQADAGIRIQGGAYIRGLYNYRSSSPPEGKYSFRLYFRGDYGPGRLEYPLFGPLEVTSFDTVVLRAGMNDPTNPFIRDELVRRLASDTGQPAAHGSIANFFLNGVFKGYYNPTERIDIDFLRSWHGGNEGWDLIAQNNEVREGDSVEWNSLLNFVSRNSMSVPSNYLETARRLDVVNFIDYALVNTYPATGDWPHNNWRAARERSSRGKFRFYVWDAEWTFGLNGRGITHNTLANELSNRDTPVGIFFTRLTNSAEFRLTFADRVHKHMFNGGALTDTNVLTRFLELRTNMMVVLPSMDTSIQRTWVPGRRSNMIRHLQSAGLFASSNAPVFSQFGGRVPAGFALGMTNMEGNIYYTTDGSDPRIPFAGAVSSNAVLYQASAPVRLAAGVTVKARSLQGSDWSALTEAAFQVAEAGAPIRITEVMYNPSGGDAYEFIELQNAGSSTVDLSFAAWSGITFTFPAGFTVKPGGVIVLASSANPAAFAARYPNVQVSGYYSGALNNGGETLALKDSLGNNITSIDYFDDGFWPAQADGGGYSLEVADPLGDTDDPANWRISSQPAGSPGAVSPRPAPAGVRINELLANDTAGNGGGDWIELYNGSSAAVDLSGWTLRDNPDLAGFAFPAGASIAAGGYLIVWCDDGATPPGLHTGFGLSSTRETVFLHDAAGGVVDAVSYGPQVESHTLARIDGAWTLGVPTRGEENRAATAAPASALRINEWMANAPSGEDDWIELHNMDTNAPAALRGLYLSTSNTVFRLASHSFVPPGGFILLHANEEPGADHVDFKLPAARGVIELHDAFAVLIDRVSYGPQVEGVSNGRYPDGVGPIIAFAGSASPGASNYVPQYSGPRINEVLARGRVGDPDWIEIYNPLATAADMGGMSLSAGDAAPGDWRFPSGTMIPAGGYLIVWWEGDRPASQAPEARLNTGKSIPREGRGVYLFNAAGQLAQKVEFGFQIPGLSIGMMSGGIWRLQSAPTPGAANGPEAQLGAPAAARINEWMAAPREGAGWLELYNPESRPVDLSGFYLADNPSFSGQTNFQIAPLSFIAPYGFQTFVADDAPEDGNDHVNFVLDPLGKMIRLYSPSRALVDAVDFGAQRTGVSVGRFPDGNSSLAEFPVSPSPDESNYFPAPVVINEILAHARPPLEGAIELHNASRNAVSIGGWHLSNDPEILKNFRIPDGVVLPGGGYKVFYQAEFDGAFSLDAARGGKIYLSATDASGSLTGWRSSVEYSPSEEGVSMGRHQASTGAEFTSLSARTFGNDAPASAQEFRAGLGARNGLPKIGPVVINEILYHPFPLAGGSGAENEDEEYVELHNSSDAPVQLFDPAHPANTWQLRGGVEFEFPQGASIPARGFALVVAFNPATDAAARAAFVDKYKPAPEVVLFGPYRGQLNNAGESVELWKPAAPVAAGRDAGLIPYVPVDRVSYRDVPPWPTEPDLGFASLQRLYPTQFGNDALHWKGASPTAGRSNQTVDDADADGDGLPDAWEAAHGLNPGQNDAALDLDADGVSNREEFLAGTNPAAASSRLRIALVGDGAGPMRVRFQAVPGRTYSVQRADDLASGIWEEVESVNGGTAVYVVDVPDYLPQTSPNRYYRVVTPRQR